MSLKAVHCCFTTMEEEKRRMAELRDRVGYLCHSCP